MISRRGAAWASIDFAHGPKNDYNPDVNPQGVVSFANAENCLMHNELTKFINENNRFETYCCAYYEGYTGTLRLRRAMATHMNNHFNPFLPIHAEDITFAAGVTDLNESCALVLCDADSNESLLLGGPVYGAFNRDLVMRTSIKLEYVSFKEEEIDQFTLDCVSRFEAGIDEAQKRGVNVKALMICNPHNPLGQCYTKDALIGLLQLCNRRNIHLLSDEIYALSVYKRDDRSSETFTSILSIEVASYINPHFVHVLYGMSKDFGAGGMRLGCVLSRNDEFVKATRSICRFSSPSQFSMYIAANFLENQAYVKSFLHTSHERLWAARILTEKILDENNIQYHRKGNAGLFVWLDLSPYLDLKGANGDAWKAQQMLATKIAEAGVEMSNGEAYTSPTPGRFRLVYCLPEHSLREGIRRISTIIHKS